MTESGSLWPHVRVSSFLLLPSLNVHSPTVWRWRQWTGMSASVVVASRVSKATDLNIFVGGQRHVWCGPYLLWVTPSSFHRLPLFNRSAEERAGIKDKPVPVWHGDPQNQCTWYKLKKSAPLSNSNLLVIGVTDKNKLMYSTVMICIQTCSQVLMNTRYIQY